MCRAHIMAFRILLLVGATFADEFKSRPPEHFQAIIPKKLSSLPEAFEKQHGAVLMCSTSIGVIVYGVPTAFQLDGVVECKPDTDSRFTECEIPTKIGWLRARKVHNTSEEIFFKTVHGSMTYREDIGIKENRFEDLIEMLFKPGVPRDEEQPVVDLRTVRECIRKALGRLGRTFSNLLSN